MDIQMRFEERLESLLRDSTNDKTPPKLRQAMHYALFPGGHRIRPKVSLAVAQACEVDDVTIAMDGAAALEFLHCASLVHDDLPCFDDADTRRGKPSVQQQYGEALAVLTGDALIVLAFQILVNRADVDPARYLQMLKVLGDSVGLPKGIVAGQAWESETKVDVDAYHKSKTGALFAAACMVGAAAAGVPHQEWKEMGKSLGQAYQVADDMIDHFGSPEVIGKPVGRDEALNRPNCVKTFGLEQVTTRLGQLISGCVASIPDCPGHAALVERVRQEANIFVNEALARRTAA